MGVCVHRCVFVRLYMMGTLKSVTDWSSIKLFYICRYKYAYRYLCMCI